jgi:hypothetical protein
MTATTRKATAGMTRTAVSFERTRQLRRPIDRPVPLAGGDVVDVVSIRWVHDLSRKMPTYRPDYTLPACPQPIPTWGS